MENSKFAKGIYFNKPNENAPSYIIGNIAIKKDQFIEWLNMQENNDIKLSVKISQNTNKPYLEINTYNNNNNNNIPL